MTEGPLVIATSGGPDSLALAVAAIDVGTRWGMEVHTVTVDHGLRAESGQEASEVAALCERLGAHAHLLRVQVGHVGGPEGAARQARRAALIQAAEEISARRCSVGGDVPVLLGHTQDDQAETVLLRLARGAGAHSLRAMDPVSRWCTGVLAVRPLLSVRRTDTHAACAQWHLEAVCDPTNFADGPWRAADGSALRRAAVREYALPALAKALGVDPVPALARSAQLLARDDDALETQALEALSGVLEGASTIRLRIEEIPAQPAIRDRVLWLAALRAGARASDLSAQHVFALSSLVTHWHGQGPVPLPGGVRAARKKSLLEFYYAEGESL